MIFANEFICDSEPKANEFTNKTVNKQIQTKGYVKYEN